MARYLGRHVIGIDQRTGKKVRYADLVEDGENRGILTTREERDAEHPQKFARRIPLDRLTIRRPSPEPTIESVTIIGNSGGSADLWEGNQTALHLSLVMGDVVVTPTAEVAPFNQVAPAITGTPREGETLTSSTGTWASTPTSYAYQWYRDGVAIGSATSSTYDLVFADVGALITVIVTASNGGGSASQVSDAVGPILQALPVNTVLPVITGTPQVGETLTVDNGTWTNTPILSYAYQWTAGGANIPGATSSSYVVTSDVAGEEIRAVVTATNAGGSAAATADPVDVAPHIDVLSENIALTGRDVFLRAARKVLVTSSDIAAAGSSVILRKASKLFVTSKNIAVAGSSVTLTQAGFMAALVKKAADQTGANYSTDTAVAWDTETFDLGGWHDTGSNTSRITVPAGVSYARLSACIAMTSVTATSRGYAYFTKNGSGGIPGLPYNSKYFPSATENYFNIVSAPVAVSQGDYFEVVLICNDVSITVEDFSWFAMERVG